MLRLTMVAVVMAALAAPVVGQVGLYAGQINADKVNVRTGPSTVNTYVLARLEQGTAVTVLQEQGEWVQIAPPPGVYSLISKRYVDRQGDVGTVTGDNVSVRAGSDIQPIAFTEVQTSLDRGTTVQITGETEEYYKVAPPAGVATWVYAQYVTRTGEAPAPQPAPAQTVETPAAQPAEPTTQPVTTAPATAPATMPATPQAATAPATQPVVSEAERLARQQQALEQLRSRIQAAFALPPEQRDYDELLAAVEALDIPADSPYQPYVTYYRQIVQIAQERAQTARQVGQILQQAQSEQQRYLAEQQRLAQQAAELRQPALYSAQGVLMPSVLYPGTGAIPKRWVLRDQATERTIAYVEPTPGVTLRVHEGQRVRVAGQHEVLPRQQVPLIRAQQVTPLD